MSVDAVVLFERIGYKDENALKAATAEERRMTSYADKGETVALPDSEFKRLSGMEGGPAVAKAGTPEAEAAGSGTYGAPYVRPEVTKPGGGSPNEPTDDGRTATDGGPPAEAEVARALALVQRASSEGMDLVRIAAEVAASDDDSGFSEAFEPLTQTSPGSSFEAANDNQRALHALKVGELERLAKDNDVEVASTDKKADLVAKLDAADVAAPAGGSSTGSP